MLKRTLISFLITTFLLIGSILFSFFYFERSQQLIIHSLSLKEVLNQKLNKYISNKINDKNFNIDVADIVFLEPKWPNLLRIELNDIKLETQNQKENSNIKLVELGFSYNDLVNNIFSKDREISLNYFNLNDLTLNGHLEKENFTPGPLLTMLLSINNDLIKKKNVKEIWKNPISIGNINFLLLDSRNQLKQRNIIINCTNVSISKHINKLRTINLNCKDDNKVQFSVRGEFGEKYNKFNGKIENMNNDIFQEIFYDVNKVNLIKNLNINLNGSYHFITDKNFKLEILNFFSEGSYINFINKRNNKSILKSKFNGEMSWKQKDNLLNFKNVSIAGEAIGAGSLDLSSQEGAVELKIKKLTLKSFQEKLISSQNYIEQFIAFAGIGDYLGSINSGSFNGVVVNLNFSFEKKIKFTNIEGYSAFENIVIQHDNDFFKKISGVISGNFKFEVFFENNKIIDNESWMEMNINASKGALYFKERNFNYKFDRANIKLKIIEDNYEISNAIFIKNKEIEYNFQNIKIEKNNIKHGYLKINNNQFVSNLLKQRLNIDLFGDTEFIFSLQGNLKNLDFKLDLYSDLLGSFFNSNLLNIRKNKNIPGSFKSEINFENGSLKNLKEIVLQIDNNTYSIESVLFNNNSFSKIALKNIKAKQLILNEVDVSIVDGDINLLISGKEIDLSGLKNNIKNKSIIEKNIIFDITADKIIFDHKIVLSGNIQGTFNKSVFESIAYGQMWLGKSSLLESGKLNMFINNKESKLNGIGLTGGAETKIKLIKKDNNYPHVTFETTDGGKLLKALGFTPNIRSGEMKIEIDFLNNSYNQYEGIIESKNFSLINAPGFINSLSILSFSGIQSIITGEGVFFNKGQAKIFVKNNVFNFDKLYLSSESLGISARGKLNLKNQFIDLRGSVAPIKLISQIISLVPAVGELITGLKKEGLFAGQFKMEGPIRKPNISLNTLSFAPGILRNIFSEDWLDNNNFFVKNNSN